MEPKSTLTEPETAKEQEPPEKTQAPLAGVAGEQQRRERRQDEAHRSGDAYPKTSCGTCERFPGYEGLFLFSDYFLP